MIPFQLSLKTTQLAARDLDLQLVQQISDLLSGHAAVFGDFESHGARNFSILGRFLQFGDDFFLFHPQPSHLTRGDGCPVPVVFYEL